MSDESLNLNNNSVQMENVEVPDSVVNHFNWGAFLLTWIWGIGNKSYITLWYFVALLFSIIPMVGSFIPFGVGIWFGVKGNEWAWKNKHFESVEKFHEYQKKWAIWGVISFVLAIILMGLMLSFVSVIFSTSSFL